MLIYTHTTHIYTHTLAHTHTYTQIPRRKYGMPSYVCTFMYIYTHLWHTFIVHTFMHMHTHIACSYMHIFTVHFYTGMHTYPATCEHESHPLSDPVLPKPCLLISLAVLGATIPGLRF